VVVQNTIVYSYIKRDEKITLRRFRKSNCFLLKEQTDKKAFETKTKKNRLKMMISARKRSRVRMNKRKVSSDK